MFTIPRKQPFRSFGILPLTMPCRQPQSRLTFAQSTRFITTSPPQGKIKQFMKKYGKVGVSVYLALSVIDLSLTMAIINVKGAEQAKQAEDWVLQKVKGWIGLPHTSSTQIEKEPSFASLFVIAYGIHKTILLPVRLSLTAAITPMVAKRFRQWGLQKASKRVK
ncbi:hypothetical protein CLU79DRAFT_396533 [Phycomyces nitens]|nr:hypothetical protein CLU79DRAFT_396533 [Phycomyces nitens]